MIYSPGIRTRSSTQYINEMLLRVTCEDLQFHLIRRPGAKSPVHGFENFLTALQA
jgi:hypothetical protein